MAFTRLQLPEDAPRNVVEGLLRKAADPSRESAMVKVNGAWRTLTWGETLHRVRVLSEALVELGVKPGDRVCIWSNTRYEWCLADLAILGTGAVTVPIYSSNTPDETAFLINDCGAKVVFVDNDTPDAHAAGRWSRLRSIRERIPSVERFIGFDLPGDPGQSLLGLADLDEIGGKAHRTHPNGLKERAERIAPSDLNTILYTSGTLGRPKGVMLTHANWVAQSYAVMQAPVLQPHDLVLLFLPLAHAFARAVESCWVCQDVRVAFAESVDRVVANAGEVRPTVVPSVPRVFEKAYNQVLADGGAKQGVEGAMFRYAMRLFDQYAAARAAGQTFRSARWELARRVVIAKISRRLSDKFGGRVRAFISGGAPLSPKIGRFFEVCGLNVLEGYGLTETCAPTHSNLVGSNRVGTVGPAFPGVEVRLTEDKEILLRGPTITRGYYHLPEESAQAVDAEGWLHTGDIGEEDADGYLRITDRKKDLIKTAGGKYVAPQVLENALKTEPLISQVAIHGDRRRFVSALVTLSEPNAIRLAEAKGIAARTLAELSQHPEIRARVQAAVDAVNQKQPSYAAIRRFAILDHDWSQETGELTATLKVKRQVVAARYKDVLDGFYGGAVE